MFQFMDHAKVFCIIFPYLSLSLSCTRFVNVPGVGKSCLLLRFSDGSFTTSFITTIGLWSLHYMMLLCSCLFPTLVEILLLIELISRYGLLSWMVRELSCKSGTLRDRSGSGLSQLVSLWFLLLYYMHSLSFLTMVGTCNTHLCGFFSLQHTTVELWAFCLCMMLPMNHLSTVTTYNLIDSF